MTRLLISVRNVAEARDALAGGADIIDIKEPSRGPLGPADPSVWHEIVREMGASVPVSAALGELAFDPVQQLASRSAGLTLAKIGLSRCGSASDWPARWCQATQTLPRGVLAVPVAYADWQLAQAPSPADVLALAAQLPSRLMLIDTYNKTQGTLLDHLSWPDLRRMVQAAKLANVELALAGSLQLLAITRLLALEPAYLGLRGAACVGGRDGVIDRARVKSLADAVRCNAAAAAV